MFHCISLQTRSILGLFTPQNDWFCMEKQWNTEMKNRRSLKWRHGLFWQQVTRVTKNRMRWRAFFDGISSSLKKWTKLFKSDRLQHLNNTLPLTHLRKSFKPQLSISAIKLMSCSWLWLSKCIGLHCSSFIDTRNNKQYCPNWWGFTSKIRPL